MSLTLAMCPVCHTAVAQSQDVCLSCGLVFASLPDGATAMRACTRCGAAARPGARICGHCGDPLPYTYVPLLSGQVLASGRYTILRPLSRGGMSTLYLATEHGAVDRTVVIKALLDYFDRTNPHEWDTARARFLQEAQTLAALRHPAIPRIFTSFRDGPHIYIAMEYIAGHDLEQGLTHTDDPSGGVIAGQPYPLEDVLRWGVALCRVLEYLASRAPEPVVHQDIKPANIVVSRGRDDIFLVDFGTAGAARAPQAGDTALLRRPSVYGTVGYAPPEQYRGQSEPRSDVYALAATLYHLATDDDPRAHPFVFARLDQLGALGQILGRALQQDAIGRPDAAHFRAQLEALLASGGAPLYAPDGVALVNPIQLADWCERNWALASGWLYDKLPDQIALWWGQPDLKDALDDIVARHADQDVGLDAALALLDPQGFGAAMPQLAADQPVLDFGRLPARTTIDRSLLISNVGRRHVRARLHGPGWMNVVLSSVSLPPAGQASLLLAADIGRPASGRRLRGEIQARDATNILVNVEAVAFRSLSLALWRRTVDGMVSVYQAFRSPTWGLWQRGVGRAARAHRVRTRRTAAQLRLRYTLMAIMLALSLAGLWAGQYFYWEEYKSAHYIAGLSALAQEDWTLARAEFERVLAVQPDYTDTPKFLRESYSRPLLTAIEDGRWESAAQIFINMEYRGLAWPELSAQIAATPEMAPALIQQRGAGWQSGKLQLVSEATDSCNVAPQIMFGPNQQSFVAVESDRNRNTSIISLCNLDDGRPSGSFQEDQFIGNVAISSDGQLLAAAGQRTAFIQRVSDASLVGELVLPEPESYPMSGQLANPDQEPYPMSGPESYPVPEQLVIPAQAIHALAFTPDGQTLISGGDGGQLSFWRVSDQKLLYKRETGSTGFGHVAVSPDGQTIATTDWASQLKLWHMADGKLLNTFPLGSRLYLESPVFSPDGLNIAFLSSNQIKMPGSVYTTRSAINIVRVSDSALVQRIPVSNQYYVLAFSSDGQTIAAGGRVLRNADDEEGEGVVSLWRVDSGALIQNVQANAGRALAFSPDGRFLITSSYTDGVKIWRPGL